MNSIERTLLWRLFAGALVLLAVGAGLLYAGSGWLLTRQFDTTLRTKLATFIALTEEEGYDIELGFDEKSMPEFGAVPEPEYFELCLAEGGSLYRSPSLASAGLPFRHGSEEAPEIWNLTLPDGRAGRAIGAEFVVHHYEAAAEDPGPARVVLVLARGRGELDRSLALLSGGTVTLILLLLCGGYVIGRSAVRRGLHPLEALVRHVRGVQDPLRAPRFPSRGVPSELAPLVDSHNQMLERLARAFEGERRTSANIAHELRTPVAELLLLTETAERWSEQEGELELRLGELRELGTQMSTLIATILELARMESGRVALEMEPLDLAEAVQACWVPLAAKAAVKRLELGTQFVDGPPARADRAALSILLTNVLANAVEHAPEGDVLVCALTRGPERVSLSLSNAAPALAAEDLENLTEPFWRKDSARADRTHAGLGLALVARLSALLDVRLAFALEQGRFRVELGFPLWNASAEAPVERNGVAHHGDGAAQESG